MTRDSLGLTEPRLAGLIVSVLVGVSGGVNTSGSEVVVFSTGRTMSKMLKPPLQINIENASFLIYLSIYLLNLLSINKSSLSISFFLSIHQSILFQPIFSIYLSLNESIFQSIYQAIHVSIFSSIHQFVYSYLSFHQSIYCLYLSRLSFTESKLSMYLSNRLFINSSICISLNTNIFLSIDLSIHYLRLRKWSSSLSESSDLSPKASTHFLTSSRSLAAWPEISFDVFMMFSTSVLTLKLRAHCYN